MNIPTFAKNKDKSNCSAGGQQFASCEVYTKQKNEGGKLPPFLIDKKHAKPLSPLNGNKTCDISRKKEKFISQEKRITLSRSEIYNLRFKAGDILGGRTASCGCKAGFDERREIAIMQKENNFYLSGVETCGSVWNCPVCALKISQRRSEQVREILTWSQTRKDCAHGFLTLTTRHNKQEKCKDVKARVLKAWRKVTQQRQYKEFDCETIRALEVKFNLQNGWHPHLHIALISEDKSQLELKVFAETFIIPTYLRFIGCETMSLNQKYKDIYAGNGVSDYITKWDLSKELTHSDTKNDFQNSFSPFAMLRELIKSPIQYEDIECIQNFYPDKSKTDKKTEIDLMRVELEHAFKEYAEAFKGSKQLTISRKLKLKFVEFDLLTDEEICKEEQASENKLNLSRELFKEIAAIRVQADILNAYQIGGLSELQMQLLEFGIDTEYNPDSNTLTTLQKFKGWGDLPINYNFYEHKPPKQADLKLFFD